MKVSVSHKNGMRFEAKTQKSSFIIDCPQISPVEYFLAGIITCSASDIVLLPKNQDKTVTNLVVDGDVERNEDHPRKFNTLHLDYKFNSDGDDIMAARWVMASLETYCSTINTIRDSVVISYSITHNGTKIKKNEKMISGGGSGIDMGEIESCPS
ncbi:OsmC family protein [Sulfurimonas sp.]|jgi:putative redox protein|uniref:OsmC family protein n=1 Tax=Sulfurimonas sp. TaxID=2022749 RepID=UPI0025E6E542|nr:OsmC family protein [Sulfurimonas sp.]MCK9474017.1 OsmC family protein [Sulfurimonas sp.]MDD3505972.1 OsmC family protein [Sulfurimonas sp.]